MKLINLIWQLPYGRRTIIRILSRMSSLDKHVTITLENILMEIDVTQTLDMAYAYGQHDTAELAFLEANSKPDDCFLDIGANIGFYSLYMAKKYPKMKILSFEPDPYNLKKFKKNIALNKLNNIILCDYAVGDENVQKELMLNTGNNRGGNSFVINQSDFCGEDMSLTVNCKTLFTALKENHVRNVGIAKLDVEGFEYPILKKFFSEAPKSMHPRAIIVEAFGNNIEKVGGSPIELLIRNDYKLVNHNYFNYYFHKY